MKKIYIVLIVLLTFTLGACNKVSLENSQKSRVKGVELAFSIVADYNPDAPLITEDLRGLKFSAKAEGNKVKAIVPSGGVDVLCLFRSDNPSDPITYKKLHFNKVAGTENRIGINTKIELAQGVTEAVGKKWYFLGIIGGTWDEGRKALSFTSTASKAIAEDEEVELEVPAISKWEELPRLVKKQGGQGYYIATEEGKATGISTVFHTQGLLVRYKIKRNSSDYNFTINGLKLTSTAMAFGLTYDLRAESLRNLSMVADDRCSNLIDYTLTPAVTSAKFFPKSNENLAEYQTYLALPQTLTIDAGARNDKYILFWTMPTAVAKRAYRTAIYLDANVSGGSRPLDKNTARYDQNHFRLLPAFYSRHRQTLTNGASIKLITEELMRPKLPIEYMATHNMKSKQNYAYNLFGLQHWTLRDGYGQRQLGASNQFARKHSFESFTDISNREALEETNIENYHIPSFDEFSGVLPMSGEYRSNPIIDFKTRTRGAYTEHRVPFKIMADNNRERPMLIRVYNTGSNVTYTIQHISAENPDHNMMLACRFSWEDNPDYQVQAQSSSYPIWQRMSYSRDYYNSSSSQTFIRHNNYEEQAVCRKYLYVTARYLNPNFFNAGDIEDIKSEYFWFQNYEDDIVRCLTPTYDYVSHLYRDAQSSENLPNTIIMCTTDNNGFSNGLTDNMSVILSGEEQTLGYIMRDEEALTSVRLFSDK